MKTKSRKANARTLSSTNFLIVAYEPGNLRQAKKEICKRDCLLCEDQPLIY